MHRRAHVKTSRALRMKDISLNTTVYNSGACPCGTPLSLPRVKGMLQSSIQPYDRAWHTETVIAVFIGQPQYLRVSNVHSGRDEIAHSLAAGLYPSAKHKIVLQSYACTPALRTEHTLVENTRRAANTRVQQQRSPNKENC